MGSFAEAMQDYRRQLEKGTIQQAYGGLMKYMLDLKTFLKNKYPDHSISGSLYQGYMDMTYFSFTPASLERRKLKTAIVFIYEAFRFEVWLAGYNKQIQTRYWGFFKESGWNKYRLVPTVKGADSILESVLVEEPDFGDLDALTRQIEKGALKFIKDVEAYLSTHE